MLSDGKAFSCRFVVWGGFPPKVYRACSGLGLEPAIRIFFSYTNGFKKLLFLPDSSLIYGPSTRTSHLRVVEVFPRSQSNLFSKPTPHLMPE